MDDMAPREQPVDLGILLAAGYQEFVRQLRAALTGQGFGDLGRSDGYVLRALAGRSMTVSALAERLGITKQGAGQLVDAMAEKAYLERQPDPDDGRARLVALAPRGRAALEAARRFHQGYERHLIRVHGADAVRGLRALLTAIVGEDTADDPRLRALYL
jgi:DNA-binding MarR family transcriptional regulator